MALVSRISVHRFGPADQDVPEAPEDILHSSLGIIFTDDVPNLHGDAEHALAYESPHLPRPLLLRLPDPRGPECRRRFGHHLWNAALLLAELIEADTLRLPYPGREERAAGSIGTAAAAAAAYGFAVGGLATLELGAGAALPSLMSALVGADRVAITDYPAPEVLETLRVNVDHNVVAEASPSGRVAGVAVEGHIWGIFERPDCVRGGEDTVEQQQQQPPQQIDTQPADDAPPESGPPPYQAADEAESASLSDQTKYEAESEPLKPQAEKHEPSPEPVAADQGEKDPAAATSTPSEIGQWDDGGFAQTARHSFDRVLAADCLWMPWQHDALRESISWFLRDDPSARAWVVAGLHTARRGMRDFFNADALANEGLEVESIWERDCEGTEREWEYDRGPEDPTTRKRWLIVAVLRRWVKGGEQEKEEGEDLIAMHADDA